MTVEGIAEAATRPTMRFVELKTEEQLDMQTLHRVRDRLVGERTALLTSCGRYYSSAG
jgi:transposase